jgi:hypothetical protein
MCNFATATNLSIALKPRSSRDVYLILIIKIQKIQKKNSKKNFKKRTKKKNHPLSVLLFFVRILREIQLKKKKKKSFLGK